MLNIGNILDDKVLSEHMSDVKKILQDKKSRDILDFIYEKRRNKNLDYSYICEYDQYFVKNLVTVNPHAVFVDAGAYHGETIEQFINFQNGQFDRIYAFEMDEDNYLRLCKNDYDERVSLLNYGLWNEHMVCKYCSDDTSSSIGEGDKMAQCVSLDEIIGDENVTFIKMDIEGAELHALLGAERTIKRCKPQLAICVYHKSNDIYEISKLLHEWIPEHKLYLRHHSVSFMETVLYAVP